MKHGIDQQVKESLESLDGIQRAEPQPFFYTRLMGRLQREEKSVWERMGAFLARPAVVVSGLCVILVMNFYMLLSQGTAGSGNTPLPVADQNEQQQTDNEYLLATNSSFYYENIDQ